MRRVVGLGQMLKVQPRVDLRGADVGVPQQLLHRPQVAAGLQHMAGKRMAQHVRVHRGGQARQQAAGGGFLLARFVQRIAQVRGQGFAVIDQEVEIGLRSIAVPILDARGRVVAALNLGLPARAEAPEALESRYLPALRAIQAELRKVLR